MEDHTDRLIARSGEVSSSRECRSSINAGLEVSGSNSSREVHAEAALDVVDFIDSKIALDDD